MSGKAARIRLTDTMYNALEKLSNQPTIAFRILTRVSIILLAFKKMSNLEIAQIVGLDRRQVGLWRRRWRDSYKALLSIEFQEGHAKLVRSIISVLSDAPRCGSPGKFTAEQFVQIIAVACEPPNQSGRPVTSWTGAELADEVHKRGIVDSISTSQVNCYLREVDLQPHKNKYWCFTTEKDRKLFDQQVEVVCQTYLQAAELNDYDNVRTTCMDEMTSLQANQQRAPGKTSKPGKVAKTECQYTRHGTVSLTGSWDVVAGQMIWTTIAETRNNVDFAKHVEQTVRTDPAASWVIVVDNLNTHCGEPLVRKVAQLLGIDQDTLGQAKKHGILKSMESRRKFLSDRSHAIRFVYIPKHSSWLNQIEVIFGIISRRVMRGGSFASKTELKTKLLAFIEYFNRTFAKPMNWTYTGKPLQTKHNNRPKTWREKRQLTQNTKKLALVT